MGKTSEKRIKLRNMKWLCKDNSYAKSKLGETFMTNMIGKIGMLSILKPTRKELILLI